MTTLAGTMLDEAWAALGGDPALTDHVQWDGPRGQLASVLAVGDLAGAVVGAAALAGSELAAQRTAQTARSAQVSVPALSTLSDSMSSASMPRVTVHSGAVAAAFGSERQLRIDGRPWTTFAPLSRFWKTADGRIRTHGNYPHHRAALLSALEITAATEDPATTVCAVADVLAACTTYEAAERITRAGGLAVPVHTPDEWSRHEQGAAVAALPLLTLRRAAGIGSASTASADTGAAAFPPMPVSPLLPAAGLRVLDFTRVISGPVATRTLGHLGADVLRVDNPRLPELREQHLDTGFGKRSTLLDLDRREDRRQLDDLIAAADVVVTGYRPGALDRHGLAPAALLERRPGLTVARLSAWSTVGPWAARRGFDSLVQATSGIAALEGDRDGVPGALPVQALDHATGYLLAAAVLRAQTRRRAEGGGWFAELSLAQTAAWLLRHLSVGDADHDATAYDMSPWLAEVDTPNGRIRHCLPPVMIDGVPRDWQRPVGPWGVDPPVFESAADYPTGATVR